jgi:hypothetical protein
VVPSSRGNDDERDAVPAGDGGDECLRAVAAGHAQQVGTAGHRVLGQLAQVVARNQHNRFDAPLFAELD